MDDNDVALLKVALGRRAKSQCAQTTQSVFRDNLGLEPSHRATPSELTMYRRGTLTQSHIRGFEAEALDEWIPAGRHDLWPSLSSRAYRQITQNRGEPCTFIEASVCKRPVRASTLSPMPTMPPQHTFMEIGDGFKAVFVSAHPAIVFRPSIRIVIVAIQSDTSQLPGMFGR